MPGGSAPLGRGERAGWWVWSWALAVLASASALAQPAADLSPVGLDRVTPHIQAGRWVWMGDSFATPTRLRVPFATLLTWPLERVGAVAVGPLSPAVRFEADDVAREITAEGGYLLARRTPLAQPMGLPLYRLFEADLPAGDSRIGTLRVDLGLLADGTAGARGRALSGGTVLRPLVYVLEGAASGRLGVEAADGVPLDAPGFRLGPPRNVPAGRQSRVPVTASLEAPGVVHLAGTVVAGLPGHTAQFLADRSWSYAGFAADAAPAPPDAVKQFRTADLAGYLAATTLDPEQPAVAVLYLAPEERAEASLRATVAQAVAGIRAGFEEAGLAEPAVLLLHAHAVESAPVMGPAANERVGVAMREIALEDPGVAFFSLYAATDGVVFDGRPEARAWLQDAGYAELSYGSHRQGVDGPLRLLDREGADLLDPLRLHPTEAGAAFFSAVLYEGLTGVRVTAPTTPVARTQLFPNPVRPGTRVSGADGSAPILDTAGRRVGWTAADGSFVAPPVAGVYLVGSALLIVQ